MSSATVILGPAAEMRDELCDPSFELEQHAMMHFVPLLTRHAGQEKTGTEVVEIILDAIDEYAARISIERLRPVLKATMRTKAQALLFVLIRENEDVMQEAWIVMRTRLLSS